MSFLLSQNSANCKLYGVIKDGNGNPIPYSSLYVASLKTGSMSNVDGEYSIQLPCGKYNIRIQSLGFQTVEASINIDGQIKKDIVLSKKDFTLKEVVVHASAEDPAYNIMRKAIVMSKYYKKQLQEYTCNIYVRSFYTVDELPGIAKLFAKEDELKRIKAGDLSETYLSYSYQYPNKVREKIISTRNARKDTTKSGSDYINLNFYHLGGTEIVSPLSKQAFQVYRFELISSYLDGKQLVNKIKIIPRRKGSDLMSGYLYINDKSWNINSVDVHFKQQMIDVFYKQIYTEINTYAWMPISHEIKINAELMGFKGHFKYLASISNIQLKTDSVIDTKIKSLVDAPLYSENDTEKDTLSTVKEVLPKLNKTEEKINALMHKEKLTRGETMKLVRLVNKENNETQKSKEDQPLELAVRHVEYADSAFTKGDSIWTDLREIPLSNEEIKTFNARDSLTRVEKGDTIINKKRNLLGTILLFDGTLKSENKKSKLKIPGILTKLSLNFNTVDGFIIDKKLFSYQRDFDKGRNFKIIPSLQYAFAREALMGKVDFTSLYDAKKRANFYWSVGKTTSDLNNEAPMPNFLNSISTLFFSENYKKLYQKEFINLGHKIDIKNGLTLNTSITYENRTQLYNNSDFKLIKWSEKTYTINRPFLQNIVNYSTIFNNNKAFTFDAQLSFTPNYHYRMIGDKKRMVYSKYPTFSMNYRQGIRNVFNSQSEYNFIGASIQQSRKVSLIDKVSYYVGGGKFINTNSIYFADYKSFNTQPFYLIGNGKVNSFQLLDFYEYSTPNHFVEAHCSVEDNYLLLKNLPLLNTTNLKEKITVNYLLTDLNVNYYEVGYSLQGLFLLFDVDFFVNFKNEHYNSLGFKLKLNFINNDSEWNK